MTDAPPPPPVDAAAVEAVRQMDSQSLLCSWAGAGAIASTRKQAARIITDAYVEQRRIKLQSFGPCSLVEYLDRQMNHMEEEEGVSQMWRLLGKCRNHLTAERVVREKLVEACRKANPWLEILSQMAEEGALGEVCVDVSSDPVAVSQAADAQLSCAFIIAALAAAEKLETSQQ